MERNVLIRIKKGSPKGFLKMIVLVRETRCEDFSNEEYGDKT